MLRKSSYRICLVLSYAASKPFISEVSGLRTSYCGTYYVIRRDSRLHSTYIYYFITSEQSISAARTCVYFPCQQTLSIVCKVARTDQTLRLQIRYGNLSPQHHTPKLHQLVPSHDIYSRGLLRYGVWKQLQQPHELGQ